MSCSALFNIIVIENYGVETHNKHNYKAGFKDVGHENDLVVAHGFERYLVWAGEKRIHMDHILLRAHLCLELMWSSRYQIVGLTFTSFN